MASNLAFYLKSNKCCQCEAGRSIASKQLITSCPKVTVTIRTFEKSILLLSLFPQSLIKEILRRLLLT